jgi:hypothetical protein
MERFNGQALELTFKASLNTGLDRPSCARLILIHFFPGRSCVFIQYAVHIPCQDFHSALLSMSTLLVDRQPEDGS